MSEVIANTALKEKLEYQRAVYKFHDCDDPALKEHFWEIIKNYRTNHPEESRPFSTGIVAELKGRQGR